LTGGHPALDLVNTLDWRFRPREPDELLTSYSDLVGFAEQSGLISPRRARQLKRETAENAGERVLRQARQLRELLAEMLYARVDGRKPDGAALRSLEAFFKSARERQKLTWADGRIQWDWSGAEAEPEFPLWLLANSACSLLLTADVEKLRACGDPECRWLFLDTSKNHTRRWCDMKVCGNRMKARRFKAQHNA
jgi:predicted RNA-binding Zn ribbon-like protein